MSITRDLMVPIGPVPPEIPVFVCIPNEYGLPSAGSPVMKKQSGSLMRSLLTMMLLSVLSKDTVLGLIQDLSQPG